MAIANSLMTGVEVLAINSAAAVPADGALSASYALPIKRSHLGGISIRITPTTDFTTLVLEIQFANNDVAAEFQTTYSSSVLAGELLTIAPLAARFLRIKKTSSTGGSGLVVGVVLS